MPKSQEKIKKEVAKKQSTKKKTSPRKKTKKEKSVVKEVPVDTPTPTMVTEPVVEPVVESVVEVVQETVAKKTLTPRNDATEHHEHVPEIRLEDNITSQLDSLLNTVIALVNQLKTVQSEVKTLQKNYVKVLKDHSKTLHKKKRVDRQPSGFAKPSKISPEMASFLSLDPKQEVPRNQVTKLINKYIIEHDLRNEKDKRQIQPNKELTKLLDLKGDEKLSYFNLQKYMKHHFIKTPSTVQVS